jgi:hypothetical protein
LRFVRDGLKESWDAATRAHYQLANVRELDRAWQSWHRVALNSGRGATSNDVLALGKARNPSSRVESN